MAMVGVDDGSLQGNPQPKLIGLVWGLEAAWHWFFLYEKSELLQWICHGDSTINSVVCIIITFTVSYCQQLLGPITVGVALNAPSDTIQVI